jgi:hypothetical protein
MDVACLLVAGWLVGWLVGCCCDKRQEREGRRDEEESSSSAVVASFLFSFSFENLNAMLYFEIYGKTGENFDRRKKSSRVARDRPYRTASFQKPVHYTLLL